MKRISFPADRSYRDRHQTRTGFSFVIGEFSGSSGSGKKICIFFQKALRIHSFFLESKLSFISKTKVLKTTFSQKELRMKRLIVIIFPKKVIKQTTYHYTISPNSNFYFQTPSSSQAPMVDFSRPPPNMTIIPTVNLSQPPSGPPLSTGPPPQANQPPPGQPPILPAGRRVYFNNQNIEFE